MSVLVEQRVATLEALRTALWGGPASRGPEGGPRDATISAHVCNLRRHIAPLGLEIVNHWSRGYELRIPPPSGENGGGRGAPTPRTARDRLA